MYYGYSKSKAVSWRLLERDTLGSVVLSESEGSLVGRRIREGN